MSGLLVLYRSLGALGGEALLTIMTRLVVLVAGLVAAILTARLLGPDGRGLYFYALTISALVSQFGSLGFGSANTYFVAQNTDRLPALAANSLWQSLLVLVVASFIVVVTSGPERGPNMTVLLAALLGSSSLFFMLASNLLVGMQRLTAFNLLQLGANLLVVPAILVTAWLKGTPDMLLVGSLSVNLMFCVIAGTVLFRSRSVDLRPHLQTFRLSLSYSFRAFLLTLIGYGVGRANVFILQAAAGQAEIGYYSIAVQIADALAILPTSIALVVFPRLVRQREGRYREMLRLAALVSVTGLLACIIAALLAEPFVKIAFGAEFRPSIAVVYAMLPGSLFLGTSTIVSQYMAASGMPWRTFAPWAGAAAILMVAAWILIPTYKSVGAAAALSLSYGVLLLGMLLAAMSLDRQLRRSEIARIKATDLKATP